MRTELSIQIRAGHRMAVMPLIALMMTSAIAACERDSGGTQSGDTSREGIATRRDSAAATAVAAYSADCDAHGRVIADTAQRRAFQTDCLARARSAARANAALSAAGQMVLSIPEYHDEQAFPTAPDAYGPVARFFASPFLGTIKEDWQVEEQGTRGMLAAIIDVEGGSGTTLPPPYANLKLQSGINCLWLTIEAGKWKAYVSQTAPLAACDPTSPRAELAVVPRKEPLHPGEDNYPAVTRFTEAAVDATGNLPTTPGQPLLSVRCIDSWCEIGPGNTDGSPAFHVGRSIAGSASREHRIKGWHDEQWLALKGTNGKLKPGFRAAFVPASRINERSADYFDRTQWTTVATVTLPVAPPTGSKYEKIGLRMGKNILEIRREAGLWLGRWSYSGSTPSKPVTIHHMTHYDAAVPGTARFRWMSDDDSLWAPCGQACCRVEPMDE